MSPRVELWQPPKNTRYKSVFFQYSKRRDLDRHVGGILCSVSGFVMFSLWSSGGSAWLLFVDYRRTRILIAWSVIYGKS